MATNTIICGLDTLEGRKFFRQSLFTDYSQWKTDNKLDIIIKRAYINCTSLNDLKDNVLYKILSDDNNLGLKDNKGAFPMYQVYSGYSMSINYLPNKIKIKNRCLKSFLTDVKENEVIMEFQDGQNAAKFTVSFGRIENDGYGNRKIVWEEPTYYNDGIKSNAKLVQLTAKKENNYEVAAKIKLNNGAEKIIKVSKLTKIEIIEYEHDYGDDKNFTIGWNETDKKFTVGETISNDILEFIDLNNPDEQRKFESGEINFINSSFRILAETDHTVQETISIQFFQPYKWGRQDYFIEELGELPADLAVVFWEKRLDQYAYLENEDNNKFAYVVFSEDGNLKIKTIHYIKHYDQLNCYLTEDNNKTKPLIIFSRKQRPFNEDLYAIYDNPYMIGLIDYFADNLILDSSLQNFVLQKNQEKNIYSSLIDNYLNFVSLEDKIYANSNEEVVFGYIPKITVGNGAVINMLTKPEPYYFLNNPSWEDNKKGSIIYAPEKIKPETVSKYLRLPFLINTHFNSVNLIHYIITNSNSN